MNGYGLIVLGASLLSVFGSSVAAAPIKSDPSITLSRQPIATVMGDVSPPKTNGYKPQRDGWVRTKQYHGREVYRRSGEVLVKFASGRMSDSQFALDPDVKSRASRILSVAPDVVHVAFDEGVTPLNTFLETLRAKPGVLHAEPNVIAHVQTIPNLQDKLWHLKRTPERKAHLAKKRGLGGAASRGRTTVCTIDTGIDLDHEDLKANIVPGVNVISTQPIGEPFDTEMDYNGHGTLVAGIIGALDNDVGVEGVNPNVSLCAIKAFDKEGNGKLSDILKGVEWATTNKIGVINLSFGSYEYSAMLDEAIQAARAAGVLVVASAGNDYADDTMYPAKYPGVLAVGSHDEGGWISRHSNWGADVTAFAPGNGLLSTNLSEYGGDRYSPFFGTSAAAAYVSGLASLLRDEGLSASQVESTLKETVYLSANAQNPTNAPYRMLNTRAIFADLERQPLDALVLSKFFVAQRVVSTSGNLEIDLAVQNVGTRAAQGGVIALKVLTANGERSIVLGDTKAIPRGGMMERHYSVPASQLAPDFSSAAGGVRALSVVPTLDATLDPGSAPLQQVFITDQPVSALSVRGLWVTPLEFSDQNTNRVLYAFIENNGNMPLSNLTVRASAIPALHEGVPKSPKTPIGSPLALASMAPGESRLIAIPIGDFVPPPNNVTFQLDFLRGGEVTKKHLQGYKYNRKRGMATPQYAQTVHRNIVNEAILLLEQQGIFIPDLQNALYRGNPESANEWPSIFGLPTTGLSSTGYWDDSTLEFFSLFGGGLNYSIIDGAHDADGVDIAFGYTEEDNFDSHFWLVDSYDDDGLNSLGSNHHSALTKLKALLYGKNGSQLAYGAIDHYKAGHKKAAWWFLGHAGHLIGDISVPSHVNNDNAHGVYGAAYHDWMDDGHHNYWNHDSAKQQGGFIDVYKENTEGDPLRFLAYTTAQVGNSVAWTSTAWATTFGSGGDRNAGGDAPHYDQYMSSLYAKIPEHGQAEWMINKDEVKDWWGDCDLVDWVGWSEHHDDCWSTDGHEDWDNSDDGGNNSDGDLSAIGAINYPYAIRAAAGLIYWFAVESGQIWPDGKPRPDVRWLPAVLGLILQ